MICIFTERDSKDFRERALKEIQLADLVLNVNYTKGKVEILKSRHPSEEIVDFTVSNLIKNHDCQKMHSSSDSILGKKYYNKLIDNYMKVTKLIYPQYGNPFFNAEVGGDLLKSNMHYEVGIESSLFEERIKDGTFQEVK